MKYPRLICRDCNNNKTGDYDRAYDLLSDWFMTQQGNHTIAEMDFREIFGADHAGGINALRRYCVKSLGCRMLASGSIFSANFPNPVMDDDVSLLQFSICRTHPFCDHENYQPDMMELMLAKGDLYAKISRSHLEATGQNMVQNAIWWENIGHFQISYWLDIDVNPEFGAAIGDYTETYRVIHSQMGLAAMKEAMWGWLSR